MKAYIFACAAILAAFGAASAASAADCGSVAQKAAAEQNGKLRSVTPSQDKEGKPICVVVISVPSTQGEKPRRVELALPLK